MTTPDAADQGEVEAQPETDDSDLEDGAPSCDGHAGAATDQIVTEPLIGLDEAHADDPCARFAVLQRKLEILSKEVHKLEQKERRQALAEHPEMELQAGIEGQREQCKQVALDVRELAKRMGAKYEREIEQAAMESAAPRRPASAQATAESDGGAPELAAEPRPAMGLQIQAGRPISSFDATCYPLCFTEFFYGDCAPNLERQAPLTYRQVFSYLMVREELEYSLDSDVEPYRAKAMCRWGRPKFAMVFASVLRSPQLLQTTKLAFGTTKAESTWKKDLGIIAKATAADFERARAIVPNQGSLAGAFGSPAVRKNIVVHTALKHLLMSTATVPLTEGHKMALRHFGFSLSNHFGSLKLFYTANFADTYSPITVLLYDGGAHRRCFRAC